MKKGRSSLLTPEAEPRHRRVTLSRANAPTETTPGTLEAHDVLADPDASDPAERVVELGVAGEAWELLRSLPPQERAVKLLSAAGYSPQEIAERLGLGLRGVRKRVQRANWRLSPCPVCGVRAGVEAGRCRGCGATRNAPV